MAAICPKVALRHAVPNPNRFGAPQSLVRAEIVFRGCKDGCVQMHTSRLFIVRANTLTCTVMPTEAAARFLSAWLARKDTPPLRNLVKGMAAPMFVVQMLQRCPKHLHCAMKHICSRPGAALAGLVLSPPGVAVKQARDGQPPTSNQSRLDSERAEKFTAEKKHFCRADSSPLLQSRSQSIVSRLNRL